jgi:hypothetical protein
MLEIKIILLEGFIAMREFPEALTVFKKKKIFRKKT